jgi:hypothetical protein
MSLLLVFTKTIQEVIMYSFGMELHGVNKALSSVEMIMSAIAIVRRKLVMAWVLLWTGMGSSLPLAHPMMKMIREVLGFSEPATPGRFRPVQRTKLVLLQNLLLLRSLV